MHSEPEQLDFVRRVADAFRLGVPQAVEPLGGTATRKFAVRAGGGRFVVRVRPGEFSDEHMIRFDHEALMRLAAEKLPVPCPQQRPDGSTWLSVGDELVEVLSWVGGQPYQADDPAAVRDVGAFLAKFHAALSDDIPSGKEGFRREDDPDLLLPYVDRLESLCTSERRRRGLERIREQLILIRRELDGRLWPELPKAVIHGDIHPGNVCFSNSRVSAVYDFDYLSTQARVRDLCDALMFFAATRDQHLDPDDIYSLTAPYRVNADWAAILLEGYSNTSPLVDCEWEAIPWILRSLWCQNRLRGSRKVEEREKLAFVLDGFFEQIDWLDRSATEFVAILRTRVKDARPLEP